MNEEIKIFMNKLREKEEENKIKINKKKEEKYNNGNGNSIDLIHIFEETFKSIYEQGIQNNGLTEKRILMRNAKIMISKIGFIKSRDFTIMCIKDWNAIKAKRWKEIRRKIPDFPDLNIICSLSKDEDIMDALDKETGIVFGIHRVSNWASEPNKEKNNSKLDEWYNDD